MAEHLHTNWGQRYWPRAIDTHFNRRPPDDRLHINRAPLRKYPSRTSNYRGNQLDEKQYEGKLPSWSLSRGIRRPATSRRRSNLEWTDEHNRNHSLDKRNRYRSSRRREYQRRNMGNVPSNQDVSETTTNKERTRNIRRLS